MLMLEFMCKVFLPFANEIWVIVYFIFIEVNRYRFRKISAAFEAKILNIEEATAISLS